ncbi:hypothetical protein GCM10009069_20620 [Algimonas arctica]|uniref:DUF885 domain-containing protein n=1 Tax=Algimonas arctica TaxID=1479486 RepID=A0A8J3CSU7_9PROT|nr:DUF885 domain-containing protein [Algimonas arctica]GHA97599.1 hypothetical protein GCM10009069_20620 [Algimonas arctica]
MTYLRPLAVTLLLLGACSQADTSTQATAPATSDVAQAESPSSEQTESAMLNAWFERRFEENVMESPEYLARLGRKDRNDEWNDETKAAWLDRMDRVRSDLEFLTQEVDVDALDEDTALSHRLYVRNAETTLEGMRWYDYNYSFNQMYGTHSGIPTFLLNQHKIENEADARAYVTRLKTIPAKMDPVIERSKTSFDKGIAPPKFVYAHLLRDIDNITSGAPFEPDAELNLMLENFRAKVELLDLSDETRETLFADAIQAMDEQVGPAYARLNAELRRQQASASADDGVWKLPDGADYYAYRLNLMTTTDLSADEIHDIGLREVDRIHAEMREIMKTVKFDGDLQAFFAFMRTDPQFYYPNTEAGKADYLAEATAIIDVMKGRLDDVFLRKPKSALEVRAVEAFREQSAGKAFYNAPASDGSRPGYYYANLYDMAQMPKYQMEALAYHEGIPGHHMQIAIAQELEGVPLFRKYGRYTPYSEGWGLYSEFLPKEMGFYEDPYSDFGRLAMELWRACRLVVDTGLHHKQWTREEAIDYLKENTPNPEGDITKAIERYIVMPGQATAYMIGKIKILELREHAKTELGDAFDIREFHDVIIASGPVPLSIMEERVNAYITATR